MERILDWNKYLDTAAKMVSEGIVMLKNENNALPLDADKEVLFSDAYSFIIIKVEQAREEW